MNQTSVIIEENPKFKAILEACLRGMRIEGVVIANLDFMRDAGAFNGLSETLNVSPDQVVVLFAKDDARMHEDPRYQEFVKRTDYVSRVVVKPGPSGIVAILREVRVQLQRKTERELR